MLRVIYGNNRIKVEDEGQNTLSALRAKRPDAQVFSFEADTFSKAEFLGLLDSMGMFEVKHITVIKYPKENTETWGFLAELIPRLAESDNGFILLETTFSADEKKLLQKHAQKITEHKKEAVAGERNIFPLANTIGKRDKKTAWAMYHTLLRDGVLPEDIFNVIFWQVKTIVVADKSKSAADAGLKPFPYTSGKSYAKNFSDTEREQLVPTLIDLYHNTRRKGLPMELALERFILGL